MNFYGFNNMGMLSVPVTYAPMILGNVAHTSQCISAAALSQAMPCIITVQS